jgi:hypothetical protein
MKQKVDIFKKAFGKVETKCVPASHDSLWEKMPKNKIPLVRPGYLNKDRVGFSVSWIQKNRGFGEYTFFMKDGKLCCDNECDSKEQVKYLLCKMVDDAKFNDTPWRPKAENSEFELEKLIAEVLARRFYDGTQDKKRIYNMTWEEYKNKSLKNWFSAARGLISIIRKCVMGLL